jgi:nitroreductase/chorismate mutase
VADNVGAKTGKHAGGQHSLIAPRQLAVLRDRIDAVDSELVQLLAVRLALVISAARYKSDPESVGDPARVSDVLAQVRLRATECGADLSAVENIYREIIHRGIQLERLAYENGQSSRPQRPVAVRSDSAVPAAGDDVMKVMATMRSMRRLDERPVAPELLDRLVQAASWAPVGTNRQSYKFVIVTDRSRLARLAPLWSKAMDFHFGALRLPVPTSEAHQFERVKAAMNYQRENFTQIPALIVVCYEPVSFWARVIHDPARAVRQLRSLPPGDGLRVLSNLRRWACRASAASVYPAVENLLLAARAHGLGANLTTWHSAFEQQFKAVLDIPHEVDIYAIVPVGYPLGRFGPVRRRPVEQLVDREHWRGGENGSP